MRPATSDEIAIAEELRRELDTISTEFTRRAYATVKRYAEEAGVLPPPHILIGLAQNLYNGNLLDECMEVCGWLEAMKPATH